MFNKGGAIGPDLTSYQKNDLDTMLLSVIDPRGGDSRGLRAGRW